MNSAFEEWRSKELTKSPPNIYPEKDAAYCLMLQATAWLAAEQERK
jgi:hypothetical protein